MVKKNLLYAQSGGVTPVINATACGLIETARQNRDRLGKVYAGKDGIILHTSVTIGYNAPWRKIHEILVEAANRTDGLKKQPPAFVMQTALSDFYVEYQLNAHLEKPETRMAVLGKLHGNIQDTFNEAAIAIVSPHYEADPPNPMPPATHEAAQSIQTTAEAAEIAPASRLLLIPMAIDL